MNRHLKTKGIAGLSAGRTLRVSLEPGWPVDHDFAAQAAWLAQQARNRGHENLHDMLERTPGVFFRLAQVWRERHPIATAA